MAPSAIHGPNSSPSTISTMSPVICGGSWARCESTAIEIKCASSTPTGTAATTPASCRIHRGNQSGSRSGHCSSRPNASMAARPTTTAWPIVTAAAGALPGKLFSAPNRTATPSASSTRRQPSASARPRGRGCAVAESMERHYRGVPARLARIPASDTAPGRRTSGCAVARSTPAVVRRMSSGNASATRTRLTLSPPCGAAR